MAGPLYSGAMDATRVGEARDGRFDELHAEGKAALSYSANSLDAVVDAYRVAFMEELGRYQALRDELDTLERLAAELPRAEGYRAVATFVQRSVGALRDGHRPSLDVAAFRRTFAGVA